MGIGLGESNARKIISSAWVVGTSFAAAHLSSADSTENPDTARLATENKAYISIVRDSLAKSNMFLQ